MITNKDVHVQERGKREEKEEEEGGRRRPLVCLVNSEKAVEGRRRRGEEGKGKWRRGNKIRGAEEKLRYGRVGNR